MCVSAPGGVPGLVRGGVWCLLQGGTCLVRGVWCLVLGVLLLGGCLVRGVCLSAFWDTTPPREQNDKQVQKYYLGHNFVAAGNYIVV